MCGCVRAQVCMRECRLMCETPRCARVSVREWLCVPRAPSLTGFPVGSRQPQTGNYHSQHTRAGPPRHPDWLWPRCSRPPGNEWMGGLSARPSAGRTGPAGTCWGQDPGSKMATVIPGPLRCCGPAGGGGGSAGVWRGRVKSADLAAWAESKEYRLEYGEPQETCLWGS